LAKKVAESKNDPRKIRRFESEKLQKVHCNVRVSFAPHVYHFCNTGKQREREKRESGINTSKQGIVDARSTHESERWSQEHDAGEPGRVVEDVVNDLGEPKT
jgi:hypothetical protein